MIGDKEFSNNCSNILHLKPDTLESSYVEILLESVKRCSELLMNHVRKTEARKHTPTPVTMYCLMSTVKERWPHLANWVR